jgi:hypothetical protein
VARFRYRFERARVAARRASHAASRAVASACDASRLAREALERSRVPVDAAAVHVALQTGHGAWLSLLDHERWGAVCAARQRACAAGLDDARRAEHRARAACEVARRRFDGFERHRGRALEAFRIEEELREELERDEARVLRS